MSAARSLLVWTDEACGARDGGVHFRVEEGFEFRALLRRQRRAAGEQGLHPVILCLGEVLIGLKPLDQHHRLLDAVSPLRGERIQRLAHRPSDGLTISGDRSEPMFAPLFLFWANGNGYHGVALSHQQGHEMYGVTEGDAEQGKAGFSFSL